VRTDPGSQRIPDHLAAMLPPDADVVAQAPARANLIGEHTDYNDGFVMPAALELRTVVAGRRSDRVRLEAVGHPGTVEVDLQTGEGPGDGWGRYVTAVVRALLDESYGLHGVEGVIASDVPVGSGLSSSAALEVSLALALLDEIPDAVSLARVCRRAENVHVGVGSGIMDPLASAGCAAGSALLVDCRSLETRDIPVPEELLLLVVDGGERRQLVSGAYDRRRAECEEAAQTIGAVSLRDVSADDLAAARLPEPIASRARHVVSENARTLAAAAALADADRAALRELFAASHASLREDFEVTTPALDTLVAVATDAPGVVASRMTGAGFGGCTVSLVEADAAARALEHVVRAYESATGRTARGWVSPAAAGALALAGG
jgi:galactokinase